MPGFTVVETSCTRTAYSVYRLEHVHFRSPFPEFSILYAMIILECVFGGRIAVPLLCVVFLNNLVLGLLLPSFDDFGFLSCMPMTKIR